ncbi:MAG: GAF domain-containing protein [Flavobacteriales bacterium]|nr:GAF domain-containing protein [Flavobacteriales bacterium]MCZ2442523.1 GAF domain-containing protein [Flavobacteriales bacterium]
MADKKALYLSLYEQAEALVADESSFIANLANIASLIHHHFSFWWTGFYMVEGKELVLGPFQGPVACSRIGYGKGVCGTAWKEERSLLVPDVRLFEGHIACSAHSKSEIVLPIFSSNEVVGVLDIDSEQLNHFDESDLEGLERIVELIRIKVLSRWKDGMYM